MPYFRDNGLRAKSWNYAHRVGIGDDDTSVFKQHLVGHFVGLDDRAFWLWPNSVSNVSMHCRWQV